MIFEMTTKVRVSVMHNNQVHDVIECSYKYLTNLFRQYDNLQLATNQGGDGLEIIDNHRGIHFECEIIDNPKSLASIYTDLCEKIDDAKKGRIPLVSEEEI